MCWFCMVEETAFASANWSHLWASFSTQNTKSAQIDFGIRARFATLQWQFCHNLSTLWLLAVRPAVSPLSPMPCLAFLPSFWAPQAPSQSWMKLGLSPRSLECFSQREWAHIGTILIEMRAKDVRGSTFVPRSALTMDIVQWVHAFSFSARGLTDEARCLAGKCSLGKLMLVALLASAPAMFFRNVRSAWWYASIASHALCMAYRCVCVHVREREIYISYIYIYTCVCK